ncbi:uncharacterized protein FOMMEDRAFT_152272 [Fomitiporia mediterranea MF3/22]|uniref:uncharacterized protein n=1 Tax=Fomitiporia mediterranea (strain MF3/22) TaxID=694068 RepID=UPI0004407D93|nr:uncharacterized protein FOMMEDRAFT_152272 [Fomitiporia mediterranea MF3/22]EJD06935.1 hypothetical protein FOMMEDRAFT_152272 [Fomitiporia mediterranea MF3/22]
MAPHTPSDLTAAFSAPKPLVSHNLLHRRSFPTADSKNPVPSYFLPDRSRILLASASPHVGVEPVELQPVPSSNKSNDDSSPQLAYIAIIIIPLLIVAVLVFVYMRRKKQKPAKKVAQLQPAVRNEPARSRADSEALPPRMQQLPRDRIRAMNSVPRDLETPMSPAADHQGYFPRAPSPPLHEYPQTTGHQLPSLAIPGPLEPLSPATTFTTNISSCPPTPCTPTFAFPPMPPLQPESTIELDENESEEGRFTWDFKCKGMTKRQSSASVEQIPDICGADDTGTEKGDLRVDSKTTLEAEAAVRAIRDGPPIIGLNIISPPGLLPAIDHPTEEVHPKAVPELDEDIPSPPEDQRLQVSYRLSILNLFSKVTSKAAGAPTPVDSAPLLDSTASEVPQSLNDDAIHLSSCSMYTVPDLNFDDTSFSLDVINALSSSPAGEFPEAPPENDNENDSKTATPVGTGEISEIMRKTSLERGKKRLVLSKPNHRVLIPASSNLKSPTLSEFVDKTDINAYTYTGLYPPANAGRKRASSDSDAHPLKRSRAHSILPVGLGISGVTEWQPLSLPVSVARISAMNSASDDKMRPKHAFHRSSFSLPIIVELAYLSSISRRAKAKHD